MDEYSLPSGPFRVARDKSKGFEAFVRGIGDSKSKHEEDKVVKQELVYLKEQAVSANVTSKETRELLICLAYCEMLGHDASFGHIHAIKFAQRTSLLEKRTGYLAASIFLRKDNELVVLLINTLQKDLKSTNVVAKSTALNVICKLIDADMIPALLPLIIATLKDKRVEIRKKALMTLQRVYTIKPSLLQDIGKHLSNAMSDPNACVVASCLHLFYDLIKKSPDNYRKYLTAFLQILTQILEGKLSEFNYHGVQAPWIQIKLLKILALLGKQQKSASETMSPVLLQIIDALPTDCNIGCAVVFECIQTITTIYALKPLLDTAFKKTGLFLTSSSSDMKCLGITAMTALVEIDLSYAGDPKQQEIILNCLDDEDNTMRKKTVELLYKIANTENVVLVSAKLLEHLRSTTEHYIKEDVVVKLTELAEKYAPDPMWYVETINDVISAAPGFVNTELPHHLMKLIATAENDKNFKTSTVSRYIQLIKKKNLPDALIHISCWVIGEYAYLVEDEYSLSDVLGRLTALLDRKFSDRTTCGWIVTAVAKLTARIGTYVPEVRGMIDRYRTGCPAELRQRCHEVNILATDMPSMACALPVDSSQDDIKVCPSLSFLDEYVYHALSADARPYRQHMKNCEEETQEQTDKTEIQITPYEHPFKNITAKSSETKVESEKPTSKTSPTANKVAPTTKPSGKDKPKPAPAPAVWGKTGYTGRKIEKQSEQSKALQFSVAESSSKSSSSSSHEHPIKSVDTEKTPDNVVQNPGDKHSAEESPAASAFFSGITKRSPPQKTSRDDPRDTVSQASLTAWPMVEQTAASSFLMDINDDEDIQPVNEGFAVGSTEEGFTEEQMSLADIQVENFLETENEEDTSSTTTVKEGLLVQLDSVNEEPLLMATTHFDVHQEDGTANLEPSSSHDDSESTTGTQLLRPTQDSFQQFDHNIEICSDSNVRLVYSTRHDPTELILSFKLINHCQARTAVEQVAITIEPPSNLVSDISSRSITVETLAFLDNITLNLPLTCQYPAAHMSFKGTLNYVLSRTSKVLHFRQEIVWTELLRPLNLTTEVFGEKWTTMSNDIRQTMASTSQKSCEEMMDSIAKNMNFTVVDIIGCEGIAAATVLGKDICLLHCKFLGDTEIWVKTTSKLSSEITMRECVTFLQKSQ